MIDLVPWLRLGATAVYAVAVFWLVRGWAKRCRLSAQESKILLYVVILGGVLGTLALNTAMQGVVPDGLGTALVMAMLVGTIAAFVAVMLA